MAAAYRFQGKIDHTEKTIQRLYKTQRYTYFKGRVLLRFGIGVALILAAAAAPLPTWLRALLLLVGAWLAVSGDFPAQIRADRVLEARKGALPGMRYEFYGDRVALSGEGSMNIPYKKFSRLVQDADYLYLFVSEDSVCMLERDSLRPQKAEDFMAFIEEKTGLSWRKEKSFLSLNLGDLRQMLRDRRQK